MSYLAWPVLIKGVLTTKGGKPFHMTLKYFGGTNISSIAIKERLAGLQIRRPDDFETPEWSMQLWKHKSTPEPFTVIELLNPPQWMQEARDRFKDLRTDDFPIYRPHVTIAANWAGAMEFVNPGSTSFDFGPLCLMGVV